MIFLFVFGPVLVILLLLLWFGLSDNNNAARVTKTYHHVSSNPKLILNGFGSLKLGMDISELDQGVHYENNSSILLIDNNQEELYYLDKLENVKSVWCYRYNVTPNITLYHVTFFFYKGKLFYLHLRDVSICNYLKLKYSFTEDIVPYEGYFNTTEYTFVTNDNNIVCENKSSRGFYPPISTKLYLKDVYDTVVNEYNQYFKERRTTEELELKNKLIDF